MTLQEEELKELRECNKQIISIKPKKEKQKHNHKQQNIVLSSDDGKYNFEIFTRKNIDIPHNFSVGLVYKTIEKTYTICRYNGDHGLHKNHIDQTIIKGFHKHVYNIDSVENGIEEDNYAIITEDYQTMEQAMISLFKDFNISNYTEFFPNLPSGDNLFNEIM